MRRYIKDLTHRTDEGMFVSKFEYFRVIYLVCKTVYPDKDFDLNQMTLDYNYDTRQGPDCLLIVYRCSPRHPGP